MVSPEQLLAFGVAALVLIAIPGPSVVFVIGRALAYGRGVALCTVLGNSLGLLVVLVLVALGLGVVVAESIAGVHGPQAASARRTSSTSASRPSGTGAGSRSRTTYPPLRCRGRRAVRQGFVVGVSNPKAFMIFAAVLPQFVDRGAGHVQAQMLLLGLLAFVIGLLLRQRVGAAREPAAHLVQRVPEAGRGDGRGRRRLDDRARRRHRGHRPTAVARPAPPPTRHLCDDTPRELLHS